MFTQRELLITLQGREAVLTQQGREAQVSLFITNAGGHNPSYIYRLLAEYYSMADRVL